MNEKLKEKFSFQPLQIAKKNFLQLCLFLHSHTFNSIILIILIDHSNNNYIARFILKILDKY